MTFETYKATTKYPEKTTTRYLRKMGASSRAITRRHVSFVEGEDALNLDGKFSISELEELINMVKDYDKA